MQIVDPTVQEVRRPISWAGYVAYAMFGSGSLVFWNAIFSVTDYWENRWDVRGDGTWFRKPFGARWLARICFGAETAEKCCLWHYYCLMHHSMR